MRKVGLSAVDANGCCRGIRSLFAPPGLAEGWPGVMGPTGLSWLSGVALGGGSVEELFFSSCDMFSSRHDVPCGCVRRGRATPYCFFGCYGIYAVGKGFIGACPCRHGCGTAKGTSFARRLYSRMPAMVA